MDIPERYVRLCLRVDRHVDGLVDSYIGPADWRQAAADDEPLDPRQLRDEARRLLDDLDGDALEDAGLEQANAEQADPGQAGLERAGLERAGLDGDRRRWLRAQLRSVECVTERLCGTRMTWADEVERCVGVRPARTDTKILEDVRRRLDAALPGKGTVRERYIVWDERNAVPRDKVVPALERLTDVLRPRAHAIAAMPAEESVGYELVSGVPWLAYNWYQGRYRSRVEVNADLPISVVLLATLAAHEVYPGHHTERTVKDAHLYRELGRLETSVAIAPAPESLVSEGLAQIALEQALGPAPFEVVADLLAGLDLGFDPVEAHAVHQAEIALYASAVNAAFMLHEDEVAAEDVTEYVREWGLDSDEKAARTVAFLGDPSSRTYVTAYPDGLRLCRAFAEHAGGNFARLLTEQLTVTDLLS